MSAYTPGPWFIKHGGTIKDAKGWTIARMNFPPADIAEANARLIAAAPDLLAALTRLLATVEPNPLMVWAPGSEVDEARAAIAKATKP